jgi:hypothetical protein
MQKPTREGAGEEGRKPRRVAKPRGLAWCGDDELGDGEGGGLLEEDRDALVSLSPRLVAWFQAKEQQQQPPARGPSAEVRSGM